MTNYDSDITTIKAGEHEYSAIIIGDENSEVPMHLMQGERLNGILVDGEEMTPFPWKGVIKDDKNLYVYFEKCNISHIDSISSKSRKNALKLIKSLAYAIERSEKDFLDLESGVFPLYRLFIVDEDKILLLPPDMGNLIAISRIGDLRRRDVLALIKKDTPENFRLIQEMGELLYLAVTGELPFEREEVRTSGFKEIPLSWYKSGLNEKTEGFITFTLDAKNKNMRQICGNLKSNKTLRWFLTRADELEWNLENRDENEKIAPEEDEKKIDTYFEKAKKETKAKNFWRVKGSIIIACSILLIVVVVIAAYYIKVALTPPLTAGLDQEGVIKAFYERQSSLDSANLDTGIKGEIPQESEVMNLYVTRQSRMAYEQLNPHVIASDWIDAGKPPIAETAFIYGVVVDEIEQIDEDTFRAKATWYTPYQYERDEDNNQVDEYTPPEGYTVVYLYSVSEDFDFKWNDRGWWIVTHVEISDYEPLGRELIETFEPDLNPIII